MSGRRQRVEWRAGAGLSQEQSWALREQGMGCGFPVRARPCGGRSGAALGLRQTRGAADRAQAGSQFAEAHRVVALAFLTLGSVRATPGDSGGGRGWGPSGAWAGAKAAWLPPGAETLQRLCGSGWPAWTRSSSWQYFHSGARRASACRGPGPARLVRPRLLPEALWAGVFCGSVDTTGRLFFS